FSFAQLFIDWIDAEADQHEFLILTQCPLYRWTEVLKLLGLGAKQLPCDRARFPGLEISGLDLESPAAGEQLVGLEFDAGAVKHRIIHATVRCGYVGRDAHAGYRDASFCGSRPQQVSEGFHSGCGEETF